MINPIASWTVRRRVVAGIVMLVIAAALATTVLVRTGSSVSHKYAGSVRTAVSPPGPTPASPLLSAPTSVHLRPALPRLPETDDPAAYAREVAVALFDVDPAATSREQLLAFWRVELPTVVYSDAAAHGLTLAAQNADAVDNLTSQWVPSQPAWASEATDHTTNRFTITSVTVPDYWVNAVAAGAFRDPGLHMERVMGVLAQSYGADAAHRHSSTRSIVIDLGLLCGPTEPGGCRLLAPQQPPQLGDS